MSDSVVILMEGFFWVVAVLAPQRRFRLGWPPSVSLFPAGTPLVAAVPKKQDPTVKMVPGSLLVHTTTPTGSLQLEF